MIHALLTEIVAELRTVLGSTSDFNSVNTQIVVGPADPPSNSAFVSVEQGNLSIQQKGKDLSSSAPRPTAAQEEIALSGVGTYPLARTPLQGTINPKLVFPAGNTRLLVADKDFTVDLNAPSFTLLSPPGDATLMLVSYSYAGVFKVQEFSQTFSVLVVDTQLTDAERWAAIASAVILSQHDELLTAFNSTEYSVGDYTTRHMLNQLHWQSNEPHTLSSPSRHTFLLTFEVKGQLTLIRELSEPVALIEQILSPEAFVENSTQPIDIRANLE